ncbi:MAG: hypothetical protein BSOLF_0037 [Candidatus Carbobacillus altaicus]|uniref:DUF418 domain-containing protein n=1 Tax=Candidatus Carbonibacillus altaicus TaxID=2163959 RepID=A0A2R6Y1P1_9BACL|nr:MAG: hypothetical protein BSOLF_0037 [Candidatus Carbobacillus altaicus]
MFSWYLSDDHQRRSLFGLMTLIIRFFGLYGKTPLWLGLIMVLLILPINIVGSHMWMRTFCYGPLEYLWRIVTYGRMFPLRKPCRKQ